VRASKKEIKKKIVANPKELTQWSFVAKPSHFKLFMKLPEGVACAAVATAHDAADNEHIQGFVETFDPICSDNLRSSIGPAIFRMAKSALDVLIGILMKGSSEHGCLP